MDSPVVSTRPPVWRSQRPAIAVIDSSAGIYLPRLSAAFPGIDFRISSGPELQTLLEDTKPEIVLCRREGTEFPREPLLNAQSVRWIHSLNAGVNHLVPWNPSRVRVTNSHGVFGDMISQYVLAAILSFCQRLPQYARQQQRQEWNPLEGISVAGRTVLILGLGAIGRNVAQRAKAFGMKTAGIRASARPTEWVDLVLAPDGLHHGLSIADFVVNCLPLTERTLGIMNEKAFKSCKEGAFYVNVGRGKLDVETALEEALRRGPLAGAALDVFDTEPLPSHHPLWHLVNVIITPHSSGIWRNWESDAAAYFEVQLKRWTTGLPLEHVIDPSVGY
jgi:phosphoglycerate dehydrogenase-like enzyme